MSCRTRIGPDHLLEENLRLVLQQHPSITSIALIFDQGVSESEILGQLETIGAKIELPEITLIPFRDADTLRTELEKLPAYTAVIILRLTEDEAGRLVAPASVHRLVRDFDRMHFYSAGFTYEFTGISDGIQADLNLLASLLADRAVELLESKGKQTDEVASLVPAVKAPETESEDDAIFIAVAGNFSLQCLAGSGLILCLLFFALWQRQRARVVELHSRLGFFEAAVGGLRAGIVALDEEDENVWMNPTLPQLFNRPPADLASFGWFDALAVGDLARLRILVGRVRATGERQSLVVGQRNESAPALEVEVTRLAPAQNRLNMATLLIFRKV